MILFDAVLLIAVSGALAVKSLYLGVITLVLGFLIGFQNLRTIHLLGRERPSYSTSKKVKALILAVIIGLCMIPFVLELPAQPNNFETTWSEETVLPIIIVVGLFAAAVMSALTVEKRKR